MRLALRLGATVMTLLFAGSQVAPAQESPGESASPDAAVRTASDRPAPDRTRENIESDHHLVAAVRTAIDHAESRWTRENIEGAVDVVAAVGGLAIGAAAIIGTGGLVVPVGAAVLSAWGAYRSTSQLVAMSRSGQSLNPLKSG